MPGYEPNTAGVYDITVENNTAVNGMCLAWGSKGRNILIANNLARFMSDLAYDTEGGENVVISGNIEAVKAACEKLKEAGARRALVLPVGGAFHSPLI